MASNPFQDFINLITNGVSGRGRYNPGTPEVSWAPPAGTPMSAQILGAPQYVQIKSPFLGDTTLANVAQNTLMGGGALPENYAGIGINSAEGTADQAMAQAAETKANMAAQPGGFEAGFAKIPGKAAEDLPTGGQILKRDMRYKTGNPEAFKPGAGEAPLNTGEELPNMPPSSSPQTTPETPSAPGKAPIPPLSAPPGTNVDMSFDSQINNVFHPDWKTNGMKNTLKMRDYLTRVGAYDYPTADAALSRVYNDYIDPGVFGDPQEVTVSKVQKAYEDALDKNEAYLPPGSNAQQASNQFVQQLLGNGQRIPPDTKVFTDNLFNLKQKASQNLTQAGTYEKLRNGAGVESLSPLEREWLSRNDALGQVLEDAHPGIKDALGAYGAIKTALPQFANIWEKLHPADLGGGEMPGLRGIAKVASSPAGKLGIAGLTGATVTAALMNMANKKTPQGLSDTAKNIENSSASDQNGSSPNEGLSKQLTPGHSTNSIPQGVNDTTPDNVYGLTGPDGGSRFLSDKDWATQVAQNNAKIAQDQAKLGQPEIKFNPTEALPLQQEITALQTQNDSLNTKYQSSKDVNDAVKAVQYASKQLDGIEQSVNGTEPSLWTLPSLPVLGGAAAMVREATDPTYSTLVNQLKQLEQSAGLPAGSLYKEGQNKQTLLSNIQNARQTIMSKFQAIVQGAMGSQSYNPTSSTPATPQGNGLPIIPQTPTNGLPTATGAGLPTPPVVDFNKVLAAPTP